jgi:hypothetical protein
MAMVKNGVPEASTNISDANMKEGAVGSVASEEASFGVASRATPRPARKRIPMSVPNLRLEVPEVPGFRLYWHKEANVERAKAAGYVLVTQDEVALNPRDIGGNDGLGGNTDLGGNVSLVHGQGATGSPERLVLMKIPMEYFKEDQLNIAMSNAEKIADIFSDEQLIGPEGEIDDRGQLVYTPSEGSTFQSRGRAEFKPVFNRPKRSVQQGRGRR